MPSNTARALRSQALALAGFVLLLGATHTAAQQEPEQGPLASLLPAQGGGAGGATHAAAARSGPAVRGRRLAQVGAFGTIDFETKLGECTQLHRAHD